MKERHLAAGPGRPARTSATTRGRTGSFCIIAAFALVILWRQGFLSSRIFCGKGHLQENNWKWVDIPPSTSLRWHRCYDDKYDCARLDVPMDWLDPSADERVVLAVSRLRATENDDYRGPVFFNPGGPGGSGIWALRDHGDLLQSIIGKNHDIVTFDPRGIGASVPRIECWNSVQRRHFWKMQDAGVVDAHPGVLYDVFARATAYSQTCEHALNSSGILTHSSTASHARDMLEILNKLGYEKLKFWGFSYGTILGGTFAAMFPDKVERLVSDGNVDYREWYLKTHINFLRDTDKVMNAFYEMCHQAGPSKCAMHDESPDKIQKRLEDLLDNLKAHPVIIPVSDDGPELPELVTYSKLKRLISATLYRPIQKFHRLAEVLAGLEQRDGRAYHDFVNSGAIPPSSVCGLEPVPPTIPLDGAMEDTDDAFPGILCADGEPLTESVEEFENYAKELQEISTAAGAVNVLFRVSCAGRKVRPKWRFTGPFTGNTSFPIMFIANMADNVTPWVSARNNSQGFGNSVILVQNSYGHTSLAAPSTCTAKAIRSYFQDGTVPTHNTKCEPDLLPFGLPAHSVTVYDSDLTPAIHELSDSATWVSGRYLL